MSAQQSYAEHGVIYISYEIEKKSLWNIGHILAFQETWCFWSRIDESYNHG